MLREVENHGAATRKPGSLDQGREKNKCAREEPSRGHPQGPRGSCPAASTTPRSCPPARCADRATSCPWGWPTSEDHERAHQFRATMTLCSATPGPQKLRRGRCARGPRAGKRPCPNLDSSSATDIETCGKHRAEKKAFRARADSAQSARQGGTEPGTTRFRDGRTTTGPPAPRRGPGAPTAQPRPRGPDLESAQI